MLVMIMLVHSLTGPSVHAGTVAHRHIKFWPCPASPAHTRHTAGLSFAQRDAEEQQKQSLNQCGHESAGGPALDLKDPWSESSYAVQDLSRVVF